MRAGCIVWRLNANGPTKKDEQAAEDPYELLVYDPGNFDKHAQTMFCSQCHRAPADLSLGHSPICRVVLFYHGRDAAFV